MVIKRILLKCVCVVVFLVVSVVIILALKSSKIRQPQSAHNNTDVKTSQMNKATAKDTEIDGSKVEKIYQMALKAKESNKLSEEESCKATVGLCQHLIEKYPDSTQAEKARELLSQVPEEHKQQYAREMTWANPPQPKVRKSKSLRSRGPRYQGQFKIPEAQ